MDLVDLAEAQPENAVRVRVHGERGRDIHGDLYGLVVDGDSPDADGVCVNNARRAAAVTVVDGPRSVVDFTGGRACVDVVDCLAFDGCLGRQTAEDPEV